MEIRQKEETRDIDTRDVSLRAAGENAAWIQRGASASMRFGNAGAKTTGETVEKTVGYVRNTARDMSLPQESRMALSYLSREQRKQWKSYSSREQAQILAAVEKKVERRMRYQESGTTSRTVPQERRDVGSAYRIPETTQRRRSNPTGSRLKNQPQDIRADRTDLKNRNRRMDDAAPVIQAGRTRNVRLAGQRENVGLADQNFKRSSPSLGSKGASQDKNRLLEQSGRVYDESSDQTKQKRQQFSIGMKRGEIRALADTRRIRKADDNRRYVYVNPRISKETLETVRRNRAQMAFREEKRAGPVIVKAYQKQTSVSGKVSGEPAAQGIRLKKMYLARQDDIASGNRGLVLRKELDRLAGGTQGHRYAVSESIRKKGIEKEYHDIFYTPNPEKAKRRIRTLEHRAGREARKESAAKKKLFARELGSLLDKDARKRESVKKMQRTEMIEQAELERETAANAVRVVALPIRVKTAQIKIQVQKKLTEALSGIGKYAAMFGGVLLLLLFLVSFFAALFGSLAGKEEENSTMYSASGSEIVEYAQSWIGITQYAYGAGRDSATDWQDYSDCSAFVHGVFSHFGIEIGWTTTAMEDIGTEVEGGLSDAMPGDIVLFYDGRVQSGNSSHVGIYAGDGMMVHNSVSRGVCMSSVGSDGRQYVVRRVLTGTTSGNSTDNTDYTEEQMEIIWAIVCQEDGGSYAGALAVISTAMNRVDSAQWSHLGSNAYEQLTASGQFCYSIDSYWQRYLGGNVPDYVKQAVSDCLGNGIRNHSHTSFRSYYTEGSEQIGGGNYYFG
ncbi:MAG: NlpC/P60 family protein [Lachnospiraceae bacterium]|nr:NlpC/P60 family protein [Lachnospiraceae bacterium]